MGDKPVSLKQVALFKTYEKEDLSDMLVDIVRFIEDGHAKYKKAMLELRWVEEFK